MGGSTKARAVSAGPAMVTITSTTHNNVQQPVVDDRNVYNEN